MRAIFNIKNKIEHIGKKKLALICFIWGGIIAFALILPTFDDVVYGRVAEWRADRLVERYHDLLIYGKFDIAHNSHTLGYGFYFPFLMRFFSVEDGTTMYCIVQSVAGIVAIPMFTLCIYLIFENLLVAIISPFVLHLYVGDLLYINKYGEYFSSLWAYSIGVPLLILLFREEKRKRFLLYSVILCIVVMLANIMRGHAGLPLIVVFVGICIYRLVRKKSALCDIVIVMIIIVLSYNLMGTAVPAFVAKIWGVEGVIPYNSSPWHSIMIGMGYIDNDYGLYYSDQSGRELIGNLFPDIEYNSAEYFEKCKEMSITILKNNPFFVIKGLFVKFYDCMKMVGKYTFGVISWHPISKRIINILFILLCIIMVFCKQMIKYIHDNKDIIIICLVMVVFSTYDSVLTDPAYTVPSAAGCGCMAVILVFISILTCIFDYCVDKIDDLRNSVNDKP